MAISSAWWKSPTIAILWIKNVLINFSICIAIKYELDIVTLACAFRNNQLQLCDNERDGVSSHRRLDCLLQRLFRRRSKKTSKLRATGLCEGNSPVTGEFPAQRASNAKNVFVWWRHHAQVWCTVYIGLLACVIHYQHECKGCKSTLKITYGVTLVGNLCKQGIRTIDRFPLHCNRRPKIISLAYLSGGGLQKW